MTVAYSIYVYQLLTKLYLLCDMHNSVYLHSLQWWSTGVHIQRRIKHNVIALRWCCDTELPHIVCRLLIAFRWKVITWHVSVSEMGLSKFSVCCSKPLTCGDRTSPFHSSQYHGCWCHGSLRRQCISTHDIKHVLHFEGFQLSASCLCGEMI